MTAELSRRVRIACWVSLGAVAVWGPVACIFPQYTFDEDVASGGGTPTSGSTGGTGVTSSSAGNATTTSNSTGDPTATSSSAGGGTSVTSSSTSSTSTAASSGGAGGSGQGGGASVSSSAVASSSASGSGGGTGTGEVCLNGSDDDGDGDIDCADSECTPGHTCVESVPFGWSGFATLFVGMPTMEPACPAAFPTNSPFKAYNTLITNPAMCSACTCSTPTGQTCDFPDSFTIRNTPCGQTAIYTGPINVPSNWSGVCYGDGYYYPAGVITCNGACNVSISSTATVASGGTCSPQGGTPTLPPNSWAYLGKACGNAPSGLGCGGGMVCQPKPAPPFLSGLCISRGGDNACPAGSFSQKHVFYDSVTDTRSCTSCTCAPASGSTCSATLTFYQETNTCITPVTTFPTGPTGGCGNLTGNPRVGARSASNIMFSGGSCFAGGGQPTGMVTPANPTTFCCVP